MLSCSVMSDSLQPHGRAPLSLQPQATACQAPLSMGILQARISEWVAMPSSRGSSQPRDRTQVSHIAGRFFTIWATREAFSRQAFFNKLDVFNCLCKKSQFCSFKGKTNSFNQFSVESKEYHGHPMSKKSSHIKSCHKPHTPCGDPQSGGNSNTELLHQKQRAWSLHLALQLLRSAPAIHDPKTSSFEKPVRFVSSRPVRLWQNEKISGTKATGYKVLSFCERGLFVYF